MSNPQNAVLRHLPHLRLLDHSPAWQAKGMKMHIRSFAFLSGFASLREATYLFEQRTTVLRARGSSHEGAAAVLLLALGNRKAYWAEAMDAPAA